MWNCLHVFMCSTCVSKHLCVIQKWQCHLLFVSIYTQAPQWAEEKVTLEYYSHVNYLMEAIEILRISFPLVNSNIMRTTTLQRIHMFWSSRLSVWCLKFHTCLNKQLFTCAGLIQFSFAKPQLGSVNGTGVELDSEDNLSFCCLTASVIALYL